MVLDDVARRADAVVVAGSTADSDVLGHRDLDVVHVLVVPDRFEHRVGESDCQEVLDCFLAEVVIDPEDRTRRKHIVHDLVQLLCALEIVAERLLDDDPAPRTCVVRRQSRSPQFVNDGWEEARRNRKVESVVPVRATDAIKVGKDMCQFDECLVGVKAARNESHP